jgi:hypothetical protein
MGIDTTDKNSRKQETIYCTQCGAQLDNYCFTKGVENIEAIQQHTAQCKKEGKFKGDLCSRLFIAEPVDPDTLNDDNDPPEP